MAIYTRKKEFTIFSMFPVSTTKFTHSTEYFLHNSSQSCGENSTIKRSLAPYLSFFDSVSTSWALASGSGSSSSGTGGNWESVAFSVLSPLVLLSFLDFW